MNINYSLDTIEHAAEQLLRAKKDVIVFCFDAEMGAGKTTFIKALASAIGANKETFSSPTFGIVNEYKTENKLLFHYDFYRLQTAEELFNIGFEDYLNTPNAIHFIEWPGVAYPFLKNYLLINFKIESNNERTLIIEDKIVE